VAEGIVVYGEDNTVVVISVFDDKVTADEATQRMIGAIVEKLGSLLVSPPETIEGEVIAHRAR
jgi:hypothetical protein